MERGVGDDLVGVRRGDLRAVVGLALLVTGVCQHPKCSRWRPATHEVKHADKCVMRLCEEHAAGVEGAVPKHNRTKIVALGRVLARLRLRRKQGGFPVAE